MQKPLPPLNALRAFEAAARHLSMAKAAEELHVTPGALSHQIRALEEFVGLALFDRGVRSIALTGAGARFYPGLRTGFAHLRDAVDTLADADDERVLVVSTVPGLTAKWLAPRLYRFSEAHPDIDVRISSTTANANFVTDGVDAAIRNLVTDAAPDPELVVDHLVDIRYTPVCSPNFLDRRGPFLSPADLQRVPLIHDDSQANLRKHVGWADWFARAGAADVDLSRGLRFNSADHALDATVQGAGVLLVATVLAYDELRTRRLVMPFDLTLESGRAYHFVCPKRAQDRPSVRAFHLWVKGEAQMIRWDECLSPHTRATA